MTAGTAIVFGTVAILAQSPFVPTPADIRARDQVTALSAALSWDSADQATSQSRMAQLPAVTSQVTPVVDRFIETSTRFAEGAEQLQSRLRFVLSAHQPNPEYGDAPRISSPRRS